MKRVLLYGLIAVIAFCILWPYLKDRFAVIPQSDSFVHVYMKSHSASLNVNNPRHKGIERTGDVPIYAYDLLMFAKLDDGRTICPMFYAWVSMPSGDPPEHKLRLAHAVGVSPGVGLDIPDDNHICELIFIVRAQSEDTGWRRFSVSMQQKPPHDSDGSVLLGEIADLLTLDKIDGSEEFNALWKKYKIAEGRFSSFSGSKAADGSIPLSR